MKVCAKLSMWTRNKWVDNKHIRDFLYCFLASHPITAASSTALGLLTLDFFPILFCTNHSSTPHEIFSVETESNSVTTVNLFVSQVYSPVPTFTRVSNRVRKNIRPIWPTFFSSLQNLWWLGPFSCLVVDPLKCRHVCFVYVFCSCVVLLFVCCMHVNIIIGFSWVQ